MSDASQAVHLTFFYKWVDFRIQQPNLLNHFVDNVAILNHLDRSEFQSDFIVQYMA